MLAGDINAIRITEEGYREEMREKEKVANEGRKEVKKRKEKKETVVTEKDEESRDWHERRNHNAGASVRRLNKPI